MKWEINKGALFIWIIFLAIVSYIVLIKKEEKTQLDKNSKIIIGTITGKSTVARGEQYLDYSYTVDGTTYNGNVPIKFCLECPSNCCSIGSDVKVRYAVGNPTNSDLVH